MLAAADAGSLNSPRHPTLLPRFATSRNLRGAARSGNPSFAEGLAGNRAAHTLENRRIRQAESFRSELNTLSFRDGEELQEGERKVEQAR